MSTKMNKKASASSSQPSSASSTPVSRRPGSPMSPTRYSRLQEKHDLQNLNDRLACYIDKVRRLETENSRLSREVQTKEENITREVTNIKAMYDSELTDARRLLDETSKERAKLEIDMKRLWDDCDVLKAKFEKKSKDCKTAEITLMSYEKKFNELQVQYNHLLADKKNSSQRIHDLEKENARLQTQLDDVRNHLEEETLHRIDLENHIQSLKEEASFKDQVFQQELSESRTRRTVDISEIDGRLAEQYEAKMKESLQELREQYEAQMRSNREEIEALYENKIKNLQQHANRNSGAATMAVEELRQTRAKIDVLNEKIIELESANNTLNCKIRELDNLRDNEKARHAEDLATLEAELARMRDEISQQLQEYQDLMDIRVALDLEIAAYSKLLESEEARLNITPASVPSETSGRAGTPSRATPLRAVKRKRGLVEEIDQRSPLDFSISNSAKGDVEISDVDPEGKFVKLTNKGYKEVSLSGWQVVRRANDLETVFKFHRTIKIEAGANICVWSVDCGATHNPPSNIVMKTQKWPVGDNMVTLLISNDGEEMATSECIKQEFSFGSSRHSGYNFKPPKGYQPNDSQGDEKCCVM